MSIFKKAYKLNAAFGMLFESRAFSLAGNMIEGYNGGQWTGAKVDDYEYAIVPCDEASKTVTVTNIENGTQVATDPRTAGAAITLIAFNHTIWHIHNKYPNAAIVASLSTYYHNLLDAIRSDTRINQGVLNAIID